MGKWLKTNSKPRIYNSWGEQKAWTERSTDLLLKVVLWSLMPLHTNIHSEGISGKVMNAFQMRNVIARARATMLVLMALGVKRFSLNLIFDFWALSNLILNGNVQLIWIVEQQTAVTSICFRYENIQRMVEWKKQRTIVRRRFHSWIREVERRKSIALNNSMGTALAFSFQGFS